MIAATPLRILVINPNTSTSITDTFRPFLSNLKLTNTSISYWTCPTGPTVIKTQAHMYESTNHCLPLLLDIVDDYDGFLAACYADHPLVRLLQSYVGSKPVVGIFDASIEAALNLVSVKSKFGILTTGQPFEVLLAEGVKHLLHGQDGEDANDLKHFGGVVASGVSLDDAQFEAKLKVMAATRRLVQNSDINIICMGGVILAGMEGWVHEACEAELGPEKGRQVRVIDQMLAGIWTLDAKLRHRHVKSYANALV
jgi:Asp/Glu/hydantoin racemase